MKIIHLINLFRGSPENNIIQRRTLESLCYAHSFASHASINVVYCLVGSDDDIRYAESLFSDMTFEGECCIINVGSYRSYAFLHGRSNPSLTDTFFHPELKSFVSAASGPDDDVFVVISNSDICLRPHAYVGIALVRSKDRDASFVINRETISTDLLDKPIAHSFAASGETHPGHDFFCMPISTYLNIDLDEGGHVVGFGFVMRPVLANLLFAPHSFWEIRSSRLSFHYGDDMPWKDQKWADVLAFNKTGMNNVYWRLHARFYGSLPDSRREMLNRFFPPSLLTSSDV